MHKLLKNEMHILCLESTISKCIIGNIQNNGTKIQEFCIYKL